MLFGDWLIVVCYFASLEFGWFRFCFWCLLWLLQWLVCLGFFVAMLVMFAVYCILLLLC